MEYKSPKESKKAKFTALNNFIVTILHYVRTLFLSIGRLNRIPSINLANRDVFCIYAKYALFNICNISIYNMIYSNIRYNNMRYNNKWHGNMWYGLSVESKTARRIYGDFFSYLEEQAGDTDARSSELL